MVVGPGEGGGQVGEIAAVRERPVGSHRLARLDNDGRRQEANGGDSHGKEGEGGGHGMLFLLLANEPVVKLRGEEDFSVKTENVDSSGREFIVKEESQSPDRKQRGTMRSTCMR